jgi:hypothetical protein
MKLSGTWLHGKGAAVLSCTQPSSPRFVTQAHSPIQTPVCWQLSLAVQLVMMQTQVPIKCILYCRQGSVP